MFVDSRLVWFLRVQAASRQRSSGRANAIKSQIIKPREWRIVTQLTVKHERLYSVSCKYRGGTRNESRERKRGV